MNTALKQISDYIGKQCYIVNKKFEYWSQFHPESVYLYDAYPYKGYLIKPLKINCIMIIGNKHILIIDNSNKSYSNADEFKYNIFFSSSDVTKAIDDYLAIKEVKNNPKINSLDWIGE